MKVFAITLCFSNPKILMSSVLAYHMTRNKGMQLDGHILVDQHYPLHREQMLESIRTLQNEFDSIRVWDPGKNLGLHGGFNWAMAQVGLKDEDIVIGYDGDSMPLGNGWDMALVRAISARRGPGQKDVVWASLGNPRTISDIKERGYDREVVDGYLELWQTKTAITNSVCAWRYGWLKRVGFLHEPRAFYGHLEAEMWGRLNKDREAWAVLPQWSESDDLRYMHDREYVAYKWFHSHTKEWPGDFKSFLDAGCPGLQASPEVLP